MARDCDPLAGDDRSRRFDLRDWLIALAFVCVAVAAYGVTRTRMAYLWDSVEFALGISNYNVVLSQPHAPGYFLYVMLGRLVNGLVGDPHASLVWMSVVAGAGLVGAMYLLGTAVFGRATGWAAGGLTLTSPMVWFYSSVALTYVVDALLVVILVLWCWRAREHGVRWGAVVGLAILLGVIGGVRQQSVPGMLLLVGSTLWLAKEQRRQKIVAAVVVWSGVTAAWVWWMLATVGGWTAYWGPLESIGRFHAAKTLLGGGLTAAGWNVFFAGVYSFTGLLLGSVGLFVALVQYRHNRSGASRFILLWIAPVFLLATLVGYTEAPGHVFTYLPGLILLAASVVSKRKVLVASFAAVNLAVFLAWPAGWDRVLWGTLRTQRELREHDRQLHDCVRVVREQFRSNETILCHWRGDLLFGLRHFQFCLPEYENVRLDPDYAMVNTGETELMTVRGPQTEFVSHIDFRKYKHVVFVVPGRATAVELMRRFELPEAATKCSLGKIDLCVSPGSEELNRLIESGRIAKVSSN